MGHNNIGLWSELTKNLPSEFKTWFAAEKAYLQKRIRKGSRVLEVGCGEGRSIHDLLPVTKHITGIDHDADAVSRAKEQFKGYPEITIVQGRAEALPFDAGSFDYVICMTTFANFGEKKYAILDEMKRVLAPDGEIIISVYADNALPVRLSEYKRLQAPVREILPDGTVVFAWGGGDNTSEQYSKEKLQAMFERAHLRIEDLMKVSIAYLCTVKESS